MQCQYMFHFICLKDGLNFFLFLFNTPITENDYILHLRLPKPMLPEPVPLPNWFKAFGSKVPDVPPPLANLLGSKVPLPPFGLKDPPVPEPDPPLVKEFGSNVPLELPPVPVDPVPLPDPKPLPVPKPLKTIISRNKDGWKSVIRGKPLRVRINLHFRPCAGLSVKLVML